MASSTPTSRVALKPPLLILHFSCLLLFLCNLGVIRTSLAPQGSPVMSSNHQRKALIALRNSFEVCNPDIQLVLHDWATNISSPEYITSDYCNWVGVHCDDASNVTTIDLTNLGLQGPLPQHVFATFYSLTQLYLSFNNFSQSIPIDLGNCTNLEELDLSHNSLSSTIPVELIRALPNMVQIDLSSNSLSGHIDFEMFSENSTSLLFLNLSNNLFSGHIPFRFSSTLIVLDLSNNFFDGSLTTQASIGAMMMNLQVLKLGTNQLVGEIPHNLFTTCGASFQELDLSWNLFWGTIPYTLGNCRSLEVLSLSRNKLSGNVPHELGMLTTLRSLILGDNNLIDLPYELRKLVSLVYLDVKRNKLSGSIPTFLGNMGEGALLEYVWLNGNNLTGVVEEWMFQKLSKLRYIDVSNNGLQGGLKPIMGGVGSLEYLILAHNRFTGGIPDNIGGLKGLKVLDVSNNELNGTISSELGSLESLSFFDAVHNNLSGPIPNMIGGRRAPSEETITPTLVPDYAGDCSPLRRWFPPDDLPDTDMDYESCARVWNRLMSGGFDQAVAAAGCTWPQEGPSYYSFVHLSHNMLSGSIPGQLPAATSSLFLDNNRLSGAVPESLYHLPLLHLSLSHNSLAGNLSAGLGNVSCLATLDLSANNFSGPIPAEMQNLVHLSALNLSFNPFLTGPIPAGGPFDSSSPSSYLGDLNLCFNQSSSTQERANSANSSASILPPSCSHAIAPTPSPPPPPSLYSHHGSSRRAFLLIAIASASTILLVVALPIRRISSCCALRSRLPTNHRHRHSSSRSVATESLSLISRRSFMEEEKWTVEMYDKRGRGGLSYSDLSLATGNFDSRSMVGRGSSSAVYKADLGRGVEICVKRVMLSGPGDVFLSQVRRVAVLRHPHLVPVLGCLYHGSEHLLLLRFMHNGSLQELLHGGDDDALDWPRCLRIASGMAKAMAFLHRQNVVHGNLKPSNVLLDHGYEAHLSDYCGFHRVNPAAVRPDGGSWTAMASPDPYAPPEAGKEFQEGTAEGDVYGFGVLLLEMVTRSTRLNDPDPGNARQMVESARSAWHERRVEEVVFPRVSATCGDTRQLVACVEVAVACTADAVAHRPSMDIVAQALHQLIRSMENLPPRIHASSA